MTVEHGPEFDLAEHVQPAVVPDGARLGLAAPWTPPTLNLGDYLHATAPQVPSAVHRSFLADRRIRPILGNGPDQTVKGIPGFQGAGDCMIAAMYRVLIAAHLNADTSPPKITGNDALRTYGKVTGYDPAQTQPDGSNPTDQGTDPVAAMDFWQQNGIDIQADGSIHRIAGTVGVDASDVGLVDRAIWEFGDGVIFAASLPNTVKAQRTVWDVVDPGLQGDSAPGSWGGHAFNGWSYDPRVFRIGTWDQEPLMTQAFREAYVTRCIVVISPEALSRTGVSAAGLDLTQLMADVKDVFGAAA